MEGKATLSKTVTRETIENQGETEFCWLYSLANSIVSSLFVRLGKLFYQCTHPAFIEEKVTDADLKQEATEFLNRPDLRQKLRRQLLFGLFPKTLTSKL